LNRSRAQGIGDTQFVTRVGTQCVPGHQLRGDLIGEIRIESTRDIDGRQFGVFVCMVRGQFSSLALQIGVFCVGL
jgi:hypothetical protein